MNISELLEKPVLEEKNVKSGKNKKQIARVVDVIDKEMISKKLERTQSFGGSEIVDSETKSFLNSMTLSKCLTKIGEVFDKEEMTGKTRRKWQSFCLIEE